MNLKKNISDSWEKIKKKIRLRIYSKNIKTTELKKNSRKIFFRNFRAYFP